VHGDACLGTGNDVERCGDDARHSRGGTRIKRGRISPLIFIADATGVSPRILSQTGSRVDMVHRIDRDDGTRGRSEADGMNATFLNHAHNVIGGLKVPPFA
jgi:hypothetical protein